MTSDDDPDRTAQDSPRENPQHLLILAYTRLFLLPERGDGSKQTTIASFGAYDVRLSELSPALRASTTCPLWVELCDSVSGRVIDCIGCQDLQDAGAAVEVFVAEAMRRGDIEPPGRPRP